MNEMIGKKMIEEIEKSKKGLNKELKKVLGAIGYEV